MDLRGTLLFLAILGVELCSIANANENLVFHVERKFKAPHHSLSEIVAHDSSRHGRLLSTVDFPLGGLGLPDEAGLYFARIRLGSPANDYHVQVDTGSDILWVNCAGCTSCPKDSSLGMDLRLFDPKESKTAKAVPCDDKFCSSMYDGPVSCTDNKCPYAITYGDQSTTSGFFVRDYITFNRLNGDNSSVSDNSSVIFGCGGKQSGTLESSNDEALDGIIGFGQANSSVLSQLAAAGKVKRVFSHCLDTIKGGGIFALGEVVEPKINKTSLIPRMAHYNVLLKELEVDGDLLQLPTYIFDSTNGRRTIIDSGTTLAYLPPMIHDQLVAKILSSKSGLELELVDKQFTCFRYTDNVDDGFPAIKFHFEGLSLIVYPHEYLFSFQDTKRCIGWIKSESQSKSGKEYLLLGDMVLSNKLVVYDLENMEIGWKDYNCSSSIEVKDETTGSVYKVVAHRLNAASNVLTGRMLTFSLSLTAMLNILVG